MRITKALAAIFISILPTFTFAEDGAVASPEGITKNDVAVEFMRCKSFFNWYPTLVNITYKGSVPQDVKDNFKKAGEVNRQFAASLIGEEEVKKQQVEIGKQVIQEISNSIKVGHESVIEYGDSSMKRCKVLSDSVAAAVKMKKEEVAAEPQLPGQPE